MRNGILFLILTLPQLALAQVVQRVADLGASPVPAGSSPIVLGNGGASTYFVARAGDTGAELYKTDGTSVGTVLLRDLMPGADGSEPQVVGVLGSELFFSAFVPESGRELWKTDGTVGGTVLVKQCTPGTRSGNPGQGAALGGVLFFPCTSLEANGRALWRTDGTAAGTYMLKDPSPGALIGNVNPPVVQSGALLYFAANDGVNGTELWASDGTTGGTAMVRDIAPGPSGSSPRNLTPFGGGVVFSASGPGLREPWRSDGTSAGTFRIADLNPSGSSNPLGFTLHAGRVFFTATEPTTGTELWVTDGTDAGTELAADLHAGASSSFPLYLASSGSALYVATTSSTFDTIAFAYDGGLTPLSGATDGGISQEARGLALHGGTPYLAFRDNDTGAAPLCSVSGSVTQEVSTFADISRLASAPFGLLVTATQLSTGEELWKSDGTPSGTTLLKDLNPTSTSAFASAAEESFRGGIPGDVASNATTLWFPARADAGVEVFTYSPGSGADAGALPSQLTFGTAFPTTPRWLSAVGDSVFFAAREGTGSTAGLFRVAAGASSPVKLAGGFGLALKAFAFPLGASAVVGLDDQETAGTTVSVVDPAGVMRSVATPLSLGPAIAANGKVFFHSTTFDGLGTNGGLWVTDGTDAGTVELNRLVSFTLLGELGLAAVGSTVFFVGSADGGLDLEPWKTDGTPAGTSRVKDIWPGSEGSWPRFVGVTSNRAYFAAGDLDAGWELWSSDGTESGTRLVADFEPGGGGGWPELEGRRLAALGTTAYVAVSTPANGVELWATDGTTTRLVTDLVPGPGSSYPRHLAAGGKRVFFAAYEPATGVELYRTDGTDAGTVRLTDLVPGPGSSNPEQLMVFGNELLFTASDPSFDRELYRITVDPTPPAIAVNLTGTKGTNDWYVTDIGVGFTVADPESELTSITGCDGGTVAADTAQVVFGCSATSLAGTSTTAVALKRDATQPGVSCPAEVIVDATSAAGAMVNFGSATATDALTPGIPVTATHQPPLNLPLGTTDVTFSATDEAGNTGSCVLKVTVRDPAAPFITCPADKTVAATGDSGASVTFVANAQDAIDPNPVVTYSHDPGSVFAPGDTVVTATARDAAGNERTCQFVVTVGKPGCGCGAGAEGPAGLLALWLLARLGRGRRRARRFDGSPNR